MKYTTTGGNAYEQTTHYQPTYALNNDYTSVYEANNYGITGATGNAGYSTSTHVATIASPKITFGKSTAGGYTNTTTQQVYNSPAINTTTTYAAAPYMK